MKDIMDSISMRLIALGLCVALISLGFGGCYYLGAKADAIERTAK